MTRLVCAVGRTCTLPLLLSGILAGCGDDQAVGSRREDKAAPSAHAGQACPAGMGGGEARPSAAGDTCCPPNPPAGMAAQASKGDLTWTLPAGWTEKPSSGMRLASFAVSGAAGEGQVSVIALAGEAGGVVANVNRWREQVGLPAKSAEEIFAGLTKGTLPIGPYSKVSIIPDDPQKQGLAVAMITRGQETLFVKLSASGKAIPGLQEGLDAFCASLRAGTTDGGQQ